MDTDTMTCPVTGKEIGPGEGSMVMDSKGNCWIVHRDANTFGQVRSDMSGKTLNGHPPIFGPDA